MNNKKRTSLTIAHVFFILLGIIGLLLSALFKNSQFETISGLCLNLGATLIATTILSYLYQMLGTKTLAEQIAETRKSLQISQTVLELGLTRIWKKRGHIPNNWWNVFTKNAKQEVWLYGVAVYGFASDQLFHEIVTEGLARDCTYRVLIIDPESDLANYWHEIDKSGVILSNVNAAIRKFSELIELNIGKSGLMELRLYKESPFISIIRADDEMIVTFYSPAIRGDDSLTIKVQSTHDGLFDQYCRHFNRVWDEATVVATTRPERTRI